MKLFENAENEVQEQTQETAEVKTEAVFDQNTYSKVQEFCIENAVQLNKDQISKLKNIFVKEAVTEEVVEESQDAPASDNSAVKDEDFKTEENSRGDDPTIDMAKDDSSQTGGEPCPCHIEDEIEKQEKNDEFVNDYDEDVKKNESAELENNQYVTMLETFVRTGVKLDDEQIEALKEEFLLEATDAKKSRRKFIDDIRKKVQKIFAEEGIKMFLQETPNAKKFKNGETDTFNLRFDAESKGLRVAAGILTGGQSELFRAMSSGSNTNLSSQNAINQFIDDCEDDIANAIKEAGSANGFDAELVRISINGIKVKATLNEDGWNALKDRKENKKAEKVDARETRKEIKAEEKEAEKAAKRAGR